MSMWKCDYCEKWLDMCPQHHCPVLREQAALFREIVTILELTSPYTLAAFRLKDRLPKACDSAPVAPEGDGD